MAGVGGEDRLDCSEGRHWKPHLNRLHGNNHLNDNRECVADCLSPGSP